MRKVLISVLLALIAVFSLFGEFSEIKTEHFDIIFDENSTLAAQKIYENCERIYAENVGFYDTLGFRIPVAITSSVKTYNGEFTSYPANLILLYNRRPGIGQMTNQSDTLLSMFTHELNHALLYNQKSKEILSISNVVSDAFAVPMLYAYQGITEGLSVWAESRDGYGRLNSPDAMALIKQAKADNQFPTWRQCTGARDTYPDGILYYNFAGAFIDYLAENYGTETLGKFVRNCSHLSLGTTRKVFENSFGLTMDKAWEDFKNSIIVPSFADMEKTQIGKAKSEYTLLFNSDEKIFCLDESENGIFSIADKHLKKIADFLSYNNCISADEKNLIIPFNDKTDEKIILYNYSLNMTEEYFGYSNACTVGKDKICLFKCMGDYSFIEITDRESKKILSSFCLGPERDAGCFCSDGTNVYFVLSENGKDTIALLDTVTETVRTFDFGNRIFIRSLSYCNDRLCFSYFTPDSTSRYGQINIGKSFTVQLSDLDISGGIWSPVVSDNQVFFIGKFMDGNTIEKTDILNLNLSSPKTITTTFIQPSEEVPVYIMEKAEQYSSLEYLKDFTFLPFVTDFSTDTLSTDSTFVLGGAYICKDPTQQWTYKAGAGYSIKDKAFTGQLSVINTSTPVDITVSLHFDFASAKDYSVGAKGAVSFSKYYDSLTSFLNLYQDIDIGFAKNKSFISTKTSVTYQKMRFADINKRNYTGVSITGQLIQSSLKSFEAQFGGLYYMPVKYIAPKLYGGFYLSNKTSNYIWAKAELSLLNLEIQKGFWDLYFNRFNIEGAYQTCFIFGQNILQHYLQGKAYFTFVPLIGVASATKIKLGAEVVYKFAPTKAYAIQLLLSASI